MNVGGVSVRGLEGLIRLVVVLAAVTLAVLPRTARATMIFPGPWQELIADADLVGVVQCTRAGGIVAEYRVVESWKGPPPGSRVTIRVPPNPHGPTYPLTLAGERWVVAAARTVRDHRIASFSTGRISPLWFRDLRADYELPLFRGRCLISPGVIELGLGGSGPRALKLPEFRAECRRLIAMTPDRLEAELLWASAEKKLFTPGEGQDYRKYPELIALRGALERSRSGRESSSFLVRLARDKRPRWAAYEALFVLDEEGRAGALAELSGLSQWRVPRGSPRLDGIRETIRRRLGISVGRRWENESDLAARPLETLDQLELDVAPGTGGERTFTALAKLTDSDPQRAARALCRWRPTRAVADSASAIGVNLVSLYGHRLATRQTELLQRLATHARDAYIRVGGAVYLAMRDHVAGIAHLQRLSRLPGLPGRWAALHLARRGQAEAIPILLADTDEAASRAEHQSGLLVGERLLELLSNAAAMSGLPQPWSRDHENIFGADPEDALPAIASWWRRYGRTARVRDPWLSQLDAQRVE